MDEDKLDAIAYALKVLLEKTDCDEGCNTCFKCDKCRAIEDLGGY